MSMNHIAAGCLFILCSCAIIAVPAIAATPSAASGHGVTTGVLDNLQKQGYDVSGIRSALTNGDTATAGNLMETFEVTHPEVSMMTGGFQEQNSTALLSQMIQTLDKLGQKGYDVSDIRAALANGDTTSAKDLMQQFGSVHPGVFTQTANEGQATDNTTMRMTRMADTIDQKGYNASDIRAAVLKGDTDTAWNLIQQFRQAHPDVIPAFR
jgi:ABC-type uncharacterized transport system substrate-binding protein